MLPRTRIVVIGVLTVGALGLGVGSVQAEPSAPAAPALAGIAPVGDLVKAARSVVAPRATRSQAPLRLAAKGPAVARKGYADDDSGEGPVGGVRGTVRRDAGSAATAGVPAANGPATPEVPQPGPVSALIGPVVSKLGL